MSGLRHTSNGLLRSTRCAMLIGFFFPVFFSEAGGERADTADKIRAVLRAHAANPIDDLIGKMHFRAFEYLYEDRFWEQSAAGDTHKTILPPFEAILDFHAQLKTEGIELIMIFPPAMAAIFPDFATNIRWDFPADGRVDSEFARFIDMLRSRGVTVIDPLSDLVANRFEAGPDGAKYPIYFPTNMHWTPLGAKLAATKVAKAIRAQPWFELQREARGMAPGTVGFHERVVMAPCPPALTYVKNLFSDGIPPAIYHEIDAPSRSEEADSQGGRDAPIQLIGDSFAKMSQERHASFRDHLQAATKLPVAMTAIDGSSSDVALRQWASKRNQARHTRVVVWEVAASSLAYENAWTRVRLDRSRNIGLVNNFDAAGSRAPSISLEVKAVQGLIAQRAIVFTAPDDRPTPQNSVSGITWRKVRLGSRPVLRTSLAAQKWKKGAATDLEFQVLFRGELIQAHTIKAGQGRRWTPWEIDLTRFSGQIGDLELRVQIEGSTGTMRGLWGEPEVWDANLSGDSSADSP